MPHSIVTRLKCHRGRRVLLVEDEELNQAVATSILENIEWVVDLAEDGLQAVEKARNGHYALILMDMNMPRMGGLEATRIIRQIPGHQRTPILALTANTAPEDKAACMAAGMNAHLSKPLDVELLYQELSRWLDDAANTIPSDVRGDSGQHRLEAEHARDSR